MSNRVSFHRLDLGLRILVAAGPTVVLVATATHLRELGGIIAFGVVAVLVAVIVLRSGVAITSTQKGVRIGFTPFWFVLLPHEKIRDVTAEDVRPFEDFGGWGIKGRARKKGLLFSAGGTSVVAFTLVDGKRYLASVRPEEAATVIQRVNKILAGAQDGGVRP